MMLPAGSLDAEFLRIQGTGRTSYKYSLVLLKMGEIIA
jgi:hypothetical protein